MPIFITTKSPHHSTPSYIALSARFRKNSLLYLWTRRKVYSFSWYLRDTMVLFRGISGWLERTDSTIGKFIVDSSESESRGKNKGIGWIRATGGWNGAKYKVRREIISPAYIHQDRVNFGRNFKQYLKILQRVCWFWHDRGLRMKGESWFPLDRCHAIVTRRPIFLMSITNDLNRLNCWGVDIVRDIRYWLCCTVVASPNEVTGRTRRTEFKVIDWSASLIRFQISPRLWSKSWCSHDARSSPNLNPLSPTERRLLPWDVFGRDSQAWVPHDVQVFNSRILYQVGDRSER